MLEASGAHGQTEQEEVGNVGLKAESPGNWLRRLSQQRGVRGKGQQRETTETVSGRRPRSVGRMLLRRGRDASLPVAFGLSYKQAVVDLGQ